MKLTKPKALQECVRIWTELARTGGGISDKYDIKGNTYATGCPCCQYREENIEEQSYCGIDCLIKWTGDHCMGFEGEYSKWSNVGTIQGRQKYARQIVKLAEQALSKLEGKSK
jgi:hypothetical protein